MTASTSTFRAFWRNTATIVTLVCLFAQATFAQQVVEPSNRVRPRERRAAPFEAAPSAATRPAADASFDASLFDYPRTPTDVRWATPKPQQLLYFVKPPTTQATVVEIPTLPAGQMPQPTRVMSMDVWWFAFKDADGEWIPGLLAVPASGNGPFPLVVATHGLFANKMQVLSWTGPSLTAAGFAVMALDLPMHGERDGVAAEILDAKRPAQMAKTWQKAIANLRQGIDVVRQSPVIVPDGPVIGLGYSLGSWMTTILGAADPRISAMVLMVGGATALPGDLLAVRGVASSDPRVAIAAFSPRPVLMLNGRNDRTVSPVMAERLFAAAKEPKELRWYETGHLLKDPAFTDAATWIRAEFTRALRKPVPTP